MTKQESRTILCGDNLQWLKSLPDESYDLIYLDPPFCTRRNFKDFSDKKNSFPVEEEDIQRLESEYPAIPDSIRAIAKLSHRDMQSYLMYMAIRLAEMRRVLNKTGSIYLHCDANASHYIRSLMDGVFGWSKFRNEIVWKRNSGSKFGAFKVLSNDTDSIFLYTKTENYIWNWDAVATPPMLDPETMKRYKHTDPDGRRFSLESMTTGFGRPNRIYEFRGFTRKWLLSKEAILKAEKDGLIVQASPDRLPKYKVYLDESRGRVLNNIWLDIPNVNGTAWESTNYSTQKPLSLLNRILSISSQEGGWVLDPFCGSGTTAVAAEMIKRNWTVMDINPESPDIVQKRITKLYGYLFTKKITVKSL